MSGVEPIWIDEIDALTLHERLLAIHGGAPGVRDNGWLQSALARPRQGAICKQDADLIDVAAAYTAGIVKNHPFVDGDKRTGFVVGVLFLELNGYRFKASEEAAASAVLALAADEIDEAGYASFIREDAEAE